MNNRKRFFMVARIFFKIILDFRKEYFLTRRKGYKYSQKKMLKVHEKRAKQLYDTAIYLKGALIKLCQYFSTRRDIFPEPYIKVLTPLLDSVPPLDFEVIETVLKKEYDDYKKYFKIIYEKPIASASIGQIHKAVLYDGSIVVLKIQKPGIEKIIDVDFAIIFFVFKLLSHFKFVKEKIDLFHLLDEFIIVTGDELNYEREIYMQKQFKEDFKKFNYVTVPGIYDEYCTKNIIVMDYLEGDNVNRVEVWSKRKNDPKIVSRRIVELYIEQLLFQAHVHFDPHPGNILITNNNNMVILDFGMSGYISNDMRTGIRDSLLAFMSKDYRKLIDIIDSLGFIRKGVNKYTLLPVVEFLFRDVLEALKFNRESIQTVDLSPIRNDLVEIIYNQPFVLPTDWAYIGKAISSVVWIIVLLNPDFKIYDELKPFADKLLRENIDKIVLKTYENVKKNAYILLSMTGRINNILENVERGYYKIKIDYSEINDKIDEFKEFIVKLVSYIISLSSLVGIYVFYSAGNNRFAVLAAIFFIISFLFALTYRHKLPKDKIKKYFEE